MKEPVICNHATPLCNQYRCPHAKVHDRDICFNNDYCDIAKTEVKCVSAPELPCS